MCLWIVVHVEDNLLLNHKGGSPLKEVFKKMVYAFTASEKRKHEEEMQKLSPRAVTYCRNIEQLLLFRADAKICKYNIYTNQFTESLS